MSQTKAQLVAPVGVVTATAMTVTGILTATTLDGIATGVAASIAQGKNLNVGVVTSSGISGDITGSATSITQGSNVTFGSLTGTFVGDLTGNAVGNVTADAVSATVIGITTSNNVSVGVITSTNFIGDGSNLSGAGGSPVSEQSVTIDGASTSIDLSNGNVIYATQSANTTVSFANSENGNVYFIRVKDDTATARTITWPSNIGWDGGSAPTLVSTPYSNEGQVFLLVTRDMGVTWYGKEVYNDEGGYELFAWGENTNGQLGHNSRTQYSSPMQVSGYWRSLPVGGNNAKAIGATKPDGTLWSWGYGGHGQLAQNDRVFRSSPTQVGTDTNWSSNVMTAAGGWASASGGTKTDGTLWTWGTNSSGVLGQNQAPAGLGYVSSPTQVGTGSDWSTVEGNYRSYWYKAAAIKTDGTLWIWGRNSSGQLGLNQPHPTQISSPTQIPGTTWATVSPNGTSYFTTAIKTNGTLWGWGYSEEGNLGLNSVSPGAYSSPVQCGTDTTWGTGVSQFAAAGKAMGAIKTDGTLWTWGTSFQGSLGQNQEDGAGNYRISSPTQVGTDTTWSLLNASNHAFTAIKTDGTLWAWGYNQQGNLGQNAGISLSSPAQVGSGTGWSRIGSNSYSSFALK